MTQHSIQQFKPKKKKNYFVQYSTNNHSFFYIKIFIKKSHNLTIPKSYKTIKLCLPNPPFEMQPNTWKHFPFPEISISGKYVFSRERFTATKHSLIPPSKIPTIIMSKLVWAKIWGLNSYFKNRILEIRCSYFVKINNLRFCLNFLFEFLQWHLQGFSYFWHLLSYFLQHLLLL